MPVENGPRDAPRPDKGQGDGGAHETGTEERKIGTIRPGRMKKASRRRLKTSSFGGVL